MARIYKYRKVTDAYTTHFLVESDYGREGEERITELCTIEGDTYVSVPDAITLPPQPEEIVIEAVELTEDLAVAIRAASPHVGLINERVVTRIRERYSVNDEIKMLRIGPSPETETYNDHVEASRAWGRAEKAKLLGLDTQEAAQLAVQAAKVQAIIDNLPSWAAVSAAIDAATTVLKLQAIVKKMARVIYWIAKSTES